MGFDICTRRTAWGGKFDVNFGREIHLNNTKNLVLTVQNRGRAQGYSGCYRLRTGEATDRGLIPGMGEKYRYLEGSSGAGLRAACNRISIARFFAGVKWPAHKTDDSHSTKAKVKDKCICNSSHPSAFIA
jgi:hypothetical protein